MANLVSNQLSYKNNKFLLPREKSLCRWTTGLMERDPHVRVTVQIKLPPPFNVVSRLRGTCELCVVTLRGGTHLIPNGPVRTAT